jgi:pyruvate formate lyase activating enzyme
VTAFHQDYKMTDPPNTPAGTLQRAYDIGKRSGLRYVYAGNLPGALGGLEDTRCHGCGELLVRRLGFRVLKNRISSGGACPACGATIPGRWA